MVSRNDIRRGYDRPANFLVLLGPAAAVLVLYVLTTHRTITWWFGSSYPLAALTLGVHYPPGSLLLTIVGWLATRLPLGLSKAYSLNLFDAALAALTCSMVMAVAVRLIEVNRRGGPSTTGRAAALATSAGAAAGCLTFATAETTWRYAVVFMPYILSALFTALLLWAIVGWWIRRESAASQRWLFLVMLLFGLDLSVHRTNLLLLPGFLLWVLLCHPSVYARLRSWLAGISGLALGLAFHLLTIPMAARDPVLNVNDPSNWARFWAYVSLQQYGGGWLVNVWPRKAALLHVQVADYLKVFSDDFASYGGLLAWLPLLLAALGLASLWRRDRRLAIGLVILFLFASIGAVVYFNLPERYFYPMDRHYLASFVIFALFLSLGAGTALGRVWVPAWRYRFVAVAVAGLLVASLPVKQVLRNFARVDGSRSSFAHDFAENALGTLEPDAILFVRGDHYNVALFVQSIEGVRRDVTILSPSLLNTDWYVRQALARDPGVPLTLSEEEVDSLSVTPWADTTIATVVEGDPGSYRLAAGEALPDTFDLHVPPTIAGRYLMPQDWILVRMIEENRWRRPIYFTLPPAWIREHTRLEGIVSRLVPRDSVSLNPDLLRENLLDHYRYRGYADPSVPMEKLSAGMGQQLVRAFHALARDGLARGDTTACIEIEREMQERIPIERIDPSPELRQLVGDFCQ
jgi:hypothetical protein